MSRCRRDTDLFVVSVFVSHLHWNTVLSPWKNRLLKSDDWKGIATNWTSLEKT